MIVKNTEFILILMVIVYYCCCCDHYYYYYYYYVTLGYYKFVCVLAVLREIRDLCMGCLASVKADESTSGYLFY